MSETWIAKGGIFDGQEFKQDIPEDAEVIQLQTGKIVQTMGAAGTITIDGRQIHRHKVVHEENILEFIETVSLSQEVA